MTNSKKDDTKPAWHALHLWQIQPIRDILIIMIVMGILYLGYIISIVTIPILLALLLAYLLEPVVIRVIRISWVTRPMASGSLIALFVLLIVVPATIGLGVATVQSASLLQNMSSKTILLQTSTERAPDSSKADRLVRTTDAEQAYSHLPKGWRWISDRYINLIENNQNAQATASDTELTEQYDSDSFTAARMIDLAIVWIQNNAAVLGKRFVGTGVGAVGAAFSMFASIGMIAFMGFLTAFFFFFFSTGYGKVLEFWEGLIPERKKGKALELAAKMDVVIAGFVRGRITIALIQSAVFTVLYAIIGVPAPLLLGPIVGILSIVPYVALLGIPVSIGLLALHDSAFVFQNTWWWILLAPVVVYFAVQALDDYVLTPLIQGKSTDMDTPSILFASIAGGALAGVYGLLIAIPVAACIKILLRELFWPRFRDWAQGKKRDFLPIEND